MKMKRALRAQLQSFGYRTPGTMQRAGLPSVFVFVILAACIFPGTQAAPVPMAPTAEYFTLEEPSALSAPLEFPDEYSISIEQAMVDRKDFAKAAILKMIFAMADDIAHEREVTTSLFETIDELQKRVNRHEEMRRALEQEVAVLKIGTPSQVKEIHPTSCRDLQEAGHKLSGFYLVRSPNGMETVFCSF